MTKSILVIGATGKQGNAVVKQLLEDGWSVRAFTRNRNNEKLTSIENEHLEIFEGDLSNEDSLAQAMQGQYGLYSVQPIIPDNVEEELRQGEMIIDTAERQGVNYVVYSTAGGVNRDRTGPHFEALAQLENKIKASRLNFTIIKPSFFMDNFLRITKVENGEIKIPEFIDPNVKFAMISSIDIAKIASTLFEDAESYNHQELEIASDELTLNEVVKTFATVTGKPTEIEGAFTSGTAERSWLEEKGYVIDFLQIERINPTRLTLDKWIAEVGF
ncbi:NmrA/HSCARG family protein [Staphylococcus caprae]|uniref:NmrA/HSCARG family protein n=1 Tax=Staphylococcus caprae TaxID=29380 RepID=UPI000E67EAA9|nr:NmrA/HSCARG family protein [Staphylococcus caprae]MDK6298761.1 NmrA/HSCARG family protein [Staphylococcus caprae]MDK7232194.1 NmrA/HSCARG family protein [Staphylococcus caprae]RIM33784.1 NmrA/HSCARG family protein [Staphylococcus caprae]